MTDRGFFRGTIKIIRYLDAAYLHWGLAVPYSPSPDTIFPDLLSNSTSVLAEDFEKPAGGVSLAVGCGRVVTDGYIYQPTHYTSNSYGQISTITSGTVAVGSNRIVSVNSSTQTGYIYDLEGNQLATFTPFTGGYWGSTYTTNETNQNFGVSVSVGCGRIVVGANLWDGPVSGSNLSQSSSNNGTVYIYDLDGNPIKKIESPYYQSGGSVDSVDSNFGFSVAVDNGRIVVGAYSHKDQPGASVTNPGKAFIYTLHGALLREIVDSNTVDGDEFGYSVAIGDGLIVVGAPGDASDDGTAMVFSRTGDFITKLNDERVDSNARFGASCAIKNDIIAIGAPDDNNNGRYENGTVVVFNLRYNIVCELTRSGGTSSYEGFGTSVSIGIGSNGSGLILASNNYGTKVYGYRIDPSSNHYWKNVTDGYSYY